MSDWLKKKSKRRFNIIEELRRNTLSQVTFYFSKVQLPILKSFQNNSMGLLLLIALVEITTP